MLTFEDGCSDDSSCGDCNREWRRFDTTRGQILVCKMSSAMASQRDEGRARDGKRPVNVAPILYVLVGRARRFEIALRMVQAVSSVKMVLRVQRLRSWSGGA